MDIAPPSLEMTPSRGGSPSAIRGVTFSRPSESAGGLGCTPIGSDRLAHAALRQATIACEPGRRFRGIATKPSTVVSSGVV